MLSRNNTWTSNYKKRILEKIRSNLKWNLKLILKMALLLMKIYFGYSITLWLFNNTNELIYKLEFEEDLLQVQFFNEKYILDVGWYPTRGKNGKFKVYVIKNYDWENPLFVRSNKKISGLIDTIKQGIKCIYSHEHLQQ